MIPLGRGKIGEELATLGPRGGGGFRVGIVDTQDVATGRVRVRFPDRDNLLSDWLFVVVPWTQNNKTFRIPDLGEQVVCLMDHLDEDGAVLGAIYSTVDAPEGVVTKDKDRTTYADGTSIEYDRETHVFTARFRDAATFTYDAETHKLQATLQDGAAIAHDAGAHQLTIDVTNQGTVAIKAQAATVTAETSAAVTAPAITLNGAVTVN